MMPSWTSILLSVVTLILALRLMRVQRMIIKVQLKLMEERQHRVHAEQLRAEAAAQADAETARHGSCNAPGHDTNAL